jgi:hypothetical protein
MDGHNRSLNTKRLGKILMIGGLGCLGVMLLGGALVWMTISFIWQQPITQSVVTAVKENAPNREQLGNVASMGAKIVASELAEDLPDDLKKQAIEAAGTFSTEAVETGANVVDSVKAQQSEAQAAR